jgi:hypothetical protein
MLRYHTINRKVYHPNCLCITNNLKDTIRQFKTFYCKKGKAVPLQVWGGPEGSRKLSLPDFLTMAQDGGKVVGFTHRPHLLPGNTPGTHLC